MRTLIAAMALGLLPLAAAAADACVPRVPPQLKMQILAEFPNYRLPRESDNLAEDIEYARKNAQSACLGVGESDFDGDGRRDVAVGLAAKHGDGWVVVVALAKGDKWNIHALSSAQAGRRRLYVTAGDPGKYERAKSLDGPLEQDEMERFKCPRATVIFGATEASGVAYCMFKGKWKHVWFSD